MTVTAERPAGGTADEVWVGIDLGTQSVRAVAVTSAGTLVGSGRRPLTSRRDGPRHEQEPGDWWAAVAGACAEALTGVPAAAVRAVAVDATSGTVLLTDSAGRPQTPGLMYDDARAGSQLPRVNEVGAGVWDRLGYGRMQVSWGLPKLLWLLDQHPRPSAGTRLAHQSDVVNGWLVGHPVPTDLSNALKTGADLIERRWPDEVLEQLGVPAGLLPPLVASGTVLGTVCAGAAEATGLPAGIAVVAGTTDGCAAQLGSGALTVGRWNSVLGTTLVLKGVTADLVHDPLGAVYSHRSPDGNWLPGGASSTGAGVISRDWAGRDLADLDRRAAARGPSSVISYPLAAQGERFPFVAPDARGFSLGDPVDEADRYSSVLRGVAHVERLCFDYLDLLGAPVDGPVVLTGGAAANRYWCQVRADVLGREVDLPENAEPAMGMAVLAASVSGPQGNNVTGSLADTAARMVRIRERIEPSTGYRDRHDEAYVRLVDQLELRGWLPTAAAAHARGRTTT